MLISSANPISKTLVWARLKLETTMQEYATPANAIMPYKIIDKTYELFKILIQIEMVCSIQL